MLTENFSSIELGDAAAYAPYFRALPLHAADYTFTNLWGWGTHYNLEWRTAHGLCWIRQKRNDLPSSACGLRWATGTPQTGPHAELVRARPSSALPSRCASCCSNACRPRGHRGNAGPVGIPVYAGSAFDPRGQQAPQEKEPRQRVHEGLWGGLPRPERRNHAAGAGAPR